MYVNERRKNRMRKPIVLIMLFMSLVLVLGGCGSEPANETPEQVESPNIEDEVAEEPAVEIEEEDSDKDDSNSLSNPFSSVNSMDEYYYEVETIIEDVQVFTTEFWVSGNKSRTESTYPETGEHIIMVMNGEEEVYYMYMPAENMVMIMDYGSGPSSLTPDEEGDIDYIGAMKELSDDEDVKIEKGTFEGEPVQIITGDIMGSKNIIWVSTKTGFPLKSEFYEDGSLASTSLFKGFNNKSVDQALFEMP
jgi:outer membrane lipoprotein-sorting protein